MVDRLCSTPPEGNCFRGFYDYTVTAAGDAPKGI